MKATRIVTVVHRDAADVPTARTITISTSCPQCSKPRGYPHPMRLPEWFTVDRWENGCGHVDLYRDLITESLTLSAPRRENRRWPHA